MANLHRVTPLGNLLAFVLLTAAGCQNRPPDPGESANQSANGQQKTADQSTEATVLQVTLNVTGMS